MLSPQLKSLDANLTNISRASLTPSRDELSLTPKNGRTHPIKLHQGHLGSSSARLPTTGMTLAKFDSTDSTYICHKSPAGKPRQCTKRTPVKFKIFTIIMSLDYPITRSFSWRWFTPISLVGSFIVITILSVVNSNHNFPTLHFQSMTQFFFSKAALTGYETVTVFQSDFNATQPPFWFDRFLRFHEPKPGTLCAGHVFNIGDPFKTNYSFFNWNVDSIIRPNAAQSGMLYTGAPLTFCDVTTVYMDGSLLTWSMDFSVVSSCVDSNLLNVTTRTSFSMGILPGRYSPLLGERLTNNGTEDIIGLILDGLFVSHLFLHLFNSY